MDKPTTGDQLRALKERAGGLSLDDIARRAGYARRSSVQEYFKPEFTARLTVKAATKLADALAGLGTPPIGRDEVLDLGMDAPDANAQPVKFEGASLDNASENLPVYGTALGAAREVEGEAIEQTTLNRGEVIEYVPRPVILNRRPEAYGLYVQGSSMHPALPDGEMVVAVPKMPLSIGDNVVVYLRVTDADEDDGQASRAVLVKELVRRTASYVELRQYSPANDFRIPMGEIVRIDKVLSRREMLS